MFIRIILLLLLIPSIVWAKSSYQGDVKIPLTTYTQLLQQSQTKATPAPADYAFGKNQIQVTVETNKTDLTAKIQLQLTITTYKNEWTLIPIIAYGTAIETARIDGQVIQLVQTPNGLAWATNLAQTATLVLNYQAEVKHQGDAYQLVLPLPQAPGGQLIAKIPKQYQNIAVTPTISTYQHPFKDHIQLTANLPTTSLVQIAWQSKQQANYAISRAFYQGQMQAQAIDWQAEYQVEVFAEQDLILPLLPTNITLTDVKINQQAATILIKDQHFAVPLKQMGQYKIQLNFQTPIQETKGPPSIQLSIPKIPISQFKLTMPGKKELQVQPNTSVKTQLIDDNTMAEFQIPMSNRLNMTWTEAVPDEVKTEVRANASLYHAIHAEEGVLHGRAITVYEITRGETNILELLIPKNVQINRIEAKNGGISDWRVDTKTQTLSVFLDSKMKGQFIFTVFYEKLLGKGKAVMDNITIPLLQAINVHRQRGMVALLSSAELMLNPTNEQQVSKVGENQLPAFVRQALTMTVAHTYKYIDPNPSLVVKAVIPERKQGKFHALIDTLISISEVTMKGSASIEMNIKSGEIMDLKLRLPEGVNLLSLSAPALRTYKINKENPQIVDVEFTQEMQGQFRLEVYYEHIMQENKAEMTVPTLAVVGAQVEHGRIAVEALTAVEVKAIATEQLSLLDINELPRQLILKTTNPILLAYKYSQTTPPYRLVLQVTHHKEIMVQEALIEQAKYSTLFTKDGLTVTTAKFFIRNSRKQFLRLKLPPNSKVWSVFVNGKTEKPAQADKTGQEILIKMINSATGFPMEVVYETKMSKMKWSGTIKAQLPQPQDMIVTRSNWDIYLPQNFVYQQAKGNLDLVSKASTVSQQTMAQTIASEHSRQQPLKIIVPNDGIHFAFEKLYANQSDQASIAFTYFSDTIAQLSWWLSMLTTILVWMGIMGLWNQRHPYLALVALILGGLLLAMTSLHFSTQEQQQMMITISVAMIAIWITLFIRYRWKHKQASKYS